MLTNFKNKFITRLYIFTNWNNRDFNLIFVIANQIIIILLKVKIFLIIAFKVAKVILKIMV